MNDANLVTLTIGLVLLVSLFQGIRRGASGSARQLLYFLLSAAFAVLSIVAAAWAASAVSPELQRWLAERAIVNPGPEASSLSQFWHTAVAGLRDLTLFRFAALFLAFYAVIRLATGFALSAIAAVVALPLSVLPASGIASRAAGAAIGAAIGAGRALLLTAVLFAYCALFPNGPFTDYIQQSGLYREAAAQIIRPATGQLLEDRLPVFADAMSAELDQLWQKRYEIIDADLPADIAQAAASVTEGKNGDEAKARALYDWVGTRVAYDNEKVRAYEEDGEWREQNPARTFETRKGVCIDYARLYAAMARSVGLDVKVVTGLGYDGRGGFGPHAWNEVFLREEGRWAPLDSTWAKSGDWFDVPAFSDTHIRKA